MNREIKFRAWGDEKTDFPGMMYFDLTMGNSCKRSKDLIVMQYTGLKDKSGKEIYKGDIVKSESGIWDNGEVLFRNGAFRVHAFVLCELIDTEIIGNIYENPELLNGSSETNNQVQQESN